MLVSVIIPCFNVTNYIGDCLASVYAQTYSNLEVICVDNNSSDDTWLKLQEFKILYPDLIIEKELTPGANSARNKGLTIANGEWIQFLDADDLLDSVKIEHQIDLLKQVNGEVGFIAAASKKIRLNKTEEQNKIKIVNPFVAAFLSQCGNTCSNLWNREALLKLGGWNTKILSSQETDLMLRLTLNGVGFVVDNDALTIIRERESGQISQSNPIHKWKQFIEIRLDYLNKLREKFPHIYDDERALLHDFLLISIINLSKFDKREAVSYFDKYLSGDWKSGNNYGISWWKVLFIKTFGIKLFFAIS